MKPFLSGKRNLDSTPLRAPHIPQGRRRHGAGRAPAPEGPSVEVVKQGDKVMRIVVTCGCGEKIEVECLYPVGS
ncbi:MAG: hypothetical protein WDM96_05280 [Lacunisphaera sp.]